MIARAACLALLLTLPEPCAGQEWVEVVANEVTPASFLPGQPAERIVTLRVPDGSTLGPIRHPEDWDGVEPAGEPRIERRAGANGRVEWTVSLPFTAWEAGAGFLSAPPVEVSFRGLDTEVETVPAPYVVASPLPGAAADMPPAPPEPPLQGDGLPWELLPLVPLGLAGITGAGWWRSRLVDRNAPLVEASGPRSVPVTSADPVAAFEEGVALLPTDPGAAALRMAESVRSRAYPDGIRVEPSASTTEVRLALAGCASELPMPALLFVLDQADGWRYGRMEVDAAALREAAHLIGPGSRP